MSSPPPTALPVDAGFTEVADRVWVARHRWCDVNVTAVAGERGLLVVDSLGSERAAGELVPALRRLHPGGVVAVVNTHEHFDHTFGNAALREAFPGVPVNAQEEAAARTVEEGERVRREYAGRPGDPHAEEVLRTRVVAADHTFASVAVVDLGDRVVELVHPGRGHTGGDAVVRVPDADALLAGDLVEESGPPAYGPDSFPLEWPATLDLVLDLVGPDTVVVPGHGSTVARAFVEAQRDDVGRVAERIRELARAGVPVERALEEEGWPLPADALAEAVRRGYAHLPPAPRTLPLV